MSSNLPPFRIGMLGAGTVGGGVYELIMGRLLDRGEGKRPLHITKICVQSLSKPRTFHLDDSITSLVSSVDSVVLDKQIELVIDAMGSDAEDITAAALETALRNGKMVVTANKDIVIRIMETLERLEQKYNSPPPALLGYEAAVCGGVPIIHVLQSCYAGDIIYKVQGIVNGTTNYMLGKMEQGLDYEEVLRESQQLGLAEPDPTYDVEGFDVRSKMCLLAKLAFGVIVPPEEVPCTGISQLDFVDFEYAKLLGCTIKLLGTAERLHESRAWDGPLSVHVSPVMIPSKQTLAGISLHDNVLAVTSSNLGTCCYTGPGTGRFPAANSIVADVLRMADGTARPPFPVPLTRTDDLDFDYTGCFYIRIPYVDGLGIIKRVGELAEEAGVSIHSIQQNPIRDRMSADFVVTTEEALVSQIQSLCDLINKQVDFCRAPCVFMPMLVDE